VRELIAASLVLVGCSYHVKGVDTGGGGGSGGVPIPVADAGLPSGGGGDDMAPRNGNVDGGPPPVASCYSEDFSPGATLADLRAAYAPQAWKADVLESLKRRIAGGHALILSQQNDSQLGSFVDTSSFDALMSSLMMVCNGETSIYDYAHATPTQFSYFLRADLTLQPTVVATFPRSEIAPYITDNATSTYDGALSGQQGQEDITAVADDLAAFTNGVACVGAVTDQLKSGINARDGMAASLYYLELYLKRARTAHATTYASLKASPEWVKFVRYAWARGMFWRRSITSSELQVAEAPIWAHVDDPTNSSEIVMFGGSPLSDIECHP